MSKNRWNFIYKRDRKFFDQDFKKAMRKFSSFRTLIQLHPIESFHLFSHAKQIPNGGAYLEIGVAFGGSLKLVSLATQYSGTSIKYFAIDPFTPYQTSIGTTRSYKKSVFLKNVRNIANVELFNIISDEAKDFIKDDSIDLLFIDGLHTYEQVKRDIINYFPKVKSGGVLLGHDFKKKFLGVKRAVAELFTDFTVLERSSIWKMEVKK